eukprot:11837425-Alexandrium_andersonii.AAC.1
MRVSELIRIPADVSNTHTEDESDATTGPCSSKSTQGCRAHHRATLECWTSRWCGPGQAAATWRCVLGCHTSWTELSASVAVSELGSERKS